MAEPKTVAEFAQRVLLGDCLTDKLTHAPPSLSLDPPRRQSFKIPTLPGRPDHLKPRSNDGRSPFPSTDQLDSEEQRAILLHFFANHELLAVELMALALLKFPDAPDAFRKGVLHTLQEEQNHTRWYLQRMKECGVEFGDYHLSPMIWSHISDMESPLDYVSRLSLTFEQANLDYAKHYAEVLREAGDLKTAKILQKIYHDEIAHVGYGIKWLRRWKEKSQSDWDAWNRQLHFPLSPIRAKGLAPFNEDGRRKAGLNDEFINRIKHFQSSRGRSPDLYWFNPDVEAKAQFPEQKTPKRIEELAADLEYAFALSAPSEDDLVLLRRLPTDAHRDYLRKHGLSFPELGSLALLEDIQKQRKIRRKDPWGNPDSKLLSKEFGLQLRQLVDTTPIEAKICQSEEEIQSFTELHSFEQWVAKPLLSSAGRGNIQFSKTHKIRGRYLIEPWLKKDLEFSLLYQVGPPTQGGIRFLGICFQNVSQTGQWLSSTSSPKPASHLPPEQAKLISHRVLPEAKKQILKALEKLLENKAFEGPLCVDSFLHQTPKGLEWHRVSEVNARWSMGRLAHQFRTKMAPNQPVTLGTLPLHEAHDQKDLILLGDPSCCTRRVAFLKIHSNLEASSMFSMPGQSANKTST